MPKAKKIKDDKPNLAQLSELAVAFNQTVQEILSEDSENLQTVMAKLKPEEMAALEQAQSVADDIGMLFSEENIKQLSDEQKESFTNVAYQNNIKVSDLLTSVFLRSIDAGQLSELLSDDIRTQEISDAYREQGALNLAKVFAPSP